MLFITAKQKIASFQGVFELQGTSCLMSSAGKIYMKLLFIQENILHINFKTKSFLYIYFLYVLQAQVTQL